MKHICTCPHLFVCEAVSLHTHTHTHTHGGDLQWSQLHVKAHILPVPAGD